jgi:hypothetical protein
MTTTLEEVKQWEDYMTIYEVIQKIESLTPEYPIKPTKPVLNSKHSTAEVLEYAQQLSQYEKDLELFKINKNSYTEERYKINDLIESYIKYATGFESAVPVKNQSKVWAKAYEDGHSSGMHNVYLHLDSLVDLFK